MNSRKIESDEKQLVSETLELNPTVSSYFFRPKHDMQIILSIIDNGEDGCNHNAYSLSKKIKNQSFSTKVISWHGNDFKSFQKITPHSRLYIDGHGASGEIGLHSHHRGDPRDVKKTPEDLVKFLLKEAPQLREQTSPRNRIKIVVLGCNAANKGEIKHSYCEILSKQLEKAGIYAVVHGYHGKVRIGIIETQTTLEKLGTFGNSLLGIEEEKTASEKRYRAAKLVNDEHHPKGYKSIFVNGKATPKDEKPATSNSTVLALGAAAIGIGAMILGSGKK